MFGLGKPRSLLGKWLDKNGLTQKWLEEQTKLSDETISRLANKQEATPNAKTMKKILNAIRKKDPKAKQEDFWPM